MYFSGKLSRVEKEQFRFSEQSLRLLFIFFVVFHGIAWLHLNTGYVLRTMLFY